MVVKLILMSRKLENVELHNDLFECLTELPLTPS